MMLVEAGSVVVDGVSEYSARADNVGGSQAATHRIPQQVGAQPFAAECTVDRQPAD